MFLMFPRPLVLLCATVPMKLCIYKGTATLQKDNFVLIASFIIKFILLSERFSLMLPKTIALDGGMV